MKGLLRTIGGMGLALLLTAGACHDSVPTSGGGGAGGVKGVWEIGKALPPGSFLPTNISVSYVPNEMVLPAEGDIAIDTPSILSQSVQLQLFYNAKKALTLINSSDGRILYRYDDSDTFAPFVYTAAPVEKGLLDPVSGPMPGVTAFDMIAPFFEGSLTQFVGYSQNVAPSRSFFQWSQDVAVEDPMVWMMDLWLEPDMSVSAPSHRDIRSLMGVFHQLRATNTDQYYDQLDYSDTGKIFVNVGRVESTAAAMVTQQTKTLMLGLQNKVIIRAISPVMTIDYTYTKEGKLQGVTATRTVQPAVGQDAVLNAVWSLGYDASGQLSKITGTMKRVIGGTESVTHLYTYDQSGDVTKIESSRSSGGLPGATFTQTFTRDAGRVVSISGVWANMEGAKEPVTMMAEYDTDDRLSALRLPAVNGEYIVKATYGDTTKEPPVSFSLNPIAPYDCTKTSQSDYKLYCATASSCGDGVCGIFEKLGTCLKDCNEVVLPPEPPLPPEGVACTQNTDCPLFKICQNKTCDSMPDTCTSDAQCRVDQGFLCKVAKEANVSKECYPTISSVSLAPVAFEFKKGLSVKWGDSFHIDGKPYSDYQVRVMMKQKTTDLSGSAWLSGPLQANGSLNLYYDELGWSVAGTSYFYCASVYPITLDASGDIKDRFDRYAKEVCKQIKY